MPRASSFAFVRRPVAALAVVLGLALGCVEPSAVSDGGPPRGRDAGSGDAGEPDAGDGDAGATDAGATDAGVTDAGVTDAGSADAAVADAGAADAGAFDAGGQDAGPEARWVADFMAFWPPAFTAAVTGYPGSYATSNLRCLDGGVASHLVYRELGFGLFYTAAVYPHLGAADAAALKASLVAMANFLGSHFTEGVMTSYASCNGLPFDPGDLTQGEAHTLGIVVRGLHAAWLVTQDAAFAQAIAAVTANPNVAAYLDWYATLLTPNLRSVTNGVASYVSVRAILLELSGGVGLTPATVGSFNHTAMLNALTSVLGAQTLQPQDATCTDTTPRNGNVTATHALAYGGWAHDATTDCMQDMGYHDIITNSLQLTLALVQRHGWCGAVNWTQYLCNQVPSSLLASLTWAYQQNPTPGLFYAVHPSSISNPPALTPGAAGQPGAYQGVELGLALLQRYRSVLQSYPAPGLKASFDGATSVTFPQLEARFVRARDELFTAAYLPGLYYALGPALAYAHDRAPP